MTSTSPESLVESPWQLPSKYREMGPSDQVSAMRNGILNFLEHAGRATLSEIVAAIGAPYDRTVRRQVQYLASTQQLYVDPVGRDPLYFRNGKLAHPVLQGNVHAGLTDYAIRTYGDSLTGRYVTITEYALTSLGEAKAKGGIRVDVADLQTFTDQLARIRKAIVEDPSLLDGGLVRRGREGRER